MNNKQKKHVRALLALVEHDVSKLDHEEIASTLSPEACDELANNVMLLLVVLEKFEGILRAAGTAGIQLKGLVK